MNTLYSQHTQYAQNTIYTITNLILTVSRYPGSVGKYNSTAVFPPASPVPNAVTFKKPIYA